MWSRRPGLNGRPAVYETAALPTELRRHLGKTGGWPDRKIFGHDSDHQRGCQLQSAVLAQAHHGPTCMKLGRGVEGPAGVSGAFWIIGGLGLFPLAMG